MSLHRLLASIVLILCSGHSFAQPNPIWWNGFEWCPNIIVLYPDDDLDGWGATDHPLQTCGLAPIGFSPWPGDCDDSDPGIWPGAPELCDGKDNNCDGVMDEGFPPVACYDGPPGTLGVGVCTAGIQICNGAAGLSCPGQVLPTPEILDGLDNDCDGQVDEDFELICDDGIDNDGDGLSDCDDPDCASFPGCGAGVELICDDEIDNDYDSLVDCDDPDCASFPGCQVELICDDEIDNDYDSLVDCDDPDCASFPGCQVELICDDEIDNDYDSLVDCDDPDCASFPGC